MSLSRDLSIKRGACVRLTKELANYAEEAKAAAAKVASMRAAGEEPHDVKHAVSRKKEKRESLKGIASMVEEKKTKTTSLALLRFPLSDPLLLPLSFLTPILNNKTKPGEHRRRVRADGPGHEAAPGGHRGRHEEAPGERRERARERKGLRFLLFSLSLSLCPSHTHTRAL